MNLGVNCSHPLLRLPEIQDELQALLDQTAADFQALPKPPSTDPVAEVLHMISTFTRDLHRHLEGTPDEGGLLQSIRPAQETFKRAIRATAPNFLPYERKDSHSRTLPFPEFLASEEEEEEDDEEECIPVASAMHIDQVMERAQM